MAGSAHARTVDEPAPYRPPALDRSHLARPVRTRPAGVECSAAPTKEQARTRRWRRTSRGLYVPAAIDGTIPEQRILEAAMVVPDGYGVTGWGALRWWSGGRWFSGTDAEGQPLPVSIATATHGVRPQRGILVSEERVWRADVASHDGVPLLAPCAALSFEARYARTLTAAITWIDMACYSDLVSLHEGHAYAHRQAGWTGVPQLRRALALADENSWSPMETRMRVLWVVGGRLGVPLTNRPVFDLRGRHLGTPDLLDPEVGLVGEYDATDYHRGQRRLGDVQREETFRSHGLEYVTMMTGESQHPRAFLERLAGAHRRACEADDRARRRWTIEPPPWWTSTTSVQARRQLDDRQRAKLLRYRSG